MFGIYVIFGGECLNCGESVIFFNGEFEVVVVVMLVY